MKREKWLGALLLASWTLNVILVVTFFMRSTYPPGSYHGSGQMPIPFKEKLRYRHPPDNEEIRDMMEQFRHEMLPLQHQRRRHLNSLKELFFEEELDTVRFQNLSDSLKSLDSKIHQQMVDHLTSVHANLSADHRRHLASRLIHGLGERRGPPKGFKDFDRRERHSERKVKSVETH